MQNTTSQGFQLLTHAYFSAIPLSIVLKQIEQSFGKGAIMRLGNATQMRIETISSRALTLHLALGGGLPKGWVIEIYGPESSGKTTLALQALTYSHGFGPGSLSNR